MTKFEYSKQATLRNHGTFTKLCACITMSQSANHTIYITTWHMYIHTVYLSSNDQHVEICHMVQDLWAISHFYIAYTYGHCIGSDLSMNNTDLV